MIDITKVVLNPIPPPIEVLQSANNKLQGENKFLKNLLIIGGVIVSIYIIDKIATHIERENERKNKGVLPNNKKNS